MIYELVAINRPTHSNLSRRQGKFGDLMKLKGVQMNWAM
jgi:hypothetical protein